MKSAALENVIYMEIKNDEVVFGNLPTGTKTMRILYGEMNIMWQPNGSITNGASRTYELDGGRIRDKELAKFLMDMDYGSDNAVFYPLPTGCYTDILAIKEAN